MHYLGGSGFEISKGANVCVPPPPQETLGWFKVPLQNGSTVYRPLVPAFTNSHILPPLHTTAQATPITGLHVLTA